MTPYRLSQFGPEQIVGNREVGRIQRADFGNCVALGILVAS